MTWRTELPNVTKEAAERDISPDFSRQERRAMLRRIVRITASEKKAAGRGGRESTNELASKNRNRPAPPTHGFRWLCALVHRAHR